MSKIRVLVANRPRLMRELVLETISEQPDIEVIGVVEDPESLVAEVEQSRPDFLIIAQGEAEERPQVCDRLLDRFPRLKILAVAADQNLSVCYRANLDICSQRVETSEEGILNALRGRILWVPITESSRSSRTN